MIRVAPSILSADFTILGKEVADIISCGAEWVHYDVMDANFVPNLSFGPQILKSLRKVSDAFIDVHLMIADPLEFAPRFCEAGASLVSFHVEAMSEERTHEALRLIRQSGVKTGLAVKPATPASALLPFIDEIDLALVMTVEPGFGGQSLVEECTDKITELNKLKNEYGYNYLIEADGGIKQSNLEMLSKKGLESAVLGSAIFNLNANERNELIEELNKI